MSKFSGAELGPLLADLDIAPVGVVHVGAHRGDEVAGYRESGFERVVLVEPEPRLAARLRAKFPGCQVVEAVCQKAKSPRKRKFNVASQRRWSSLLPIPSDQSTAGTIETVDTITVAAVTLAEVQDGCNVAVVDTQGTEPDVLHGANLDDLDLVVVETVAPSDVFRPAWPRPDADAWFAARGWRPVAEFAHSAPDVADVAYAPAR